MTQKQAHRVGSEPVKNSNQVEPEVPQELDSEFAVLDALEAAVQPSGDPKVMTLEVPDKPTVSIVYKYDIEFDQFQMWQKRAVLDKKTGELDYMKLSIPVLSTCCVGIKVKGKLATKDGEPMTFAHPRIHEMLKVPTGSTAKAIRTLYGLDGQVIQTMRTIIEKAGYAIDGEIHEVQDDNPLDD